MEFVEGYEVHNVVDIIMLVRHGIVTFTRKPDEDIYPNMLNMVSGHIDSSDGYDPLKAAARELEEETGLNVRQDRLVFVGNYKYVDDKIRAKFNIAVYMLNISEEEFNSITEKEHVPGSKRIIPYEDVHQFLKDFNPAEAYILGLLIAKRP